MGVCICAELVQGCLKDEEAAKQWLILWRVSLSTSVAAAINSWITCNSLRVWTR